VTIPAAELKLEYIDGTRLGHKNVYFFSEDDATLSTMLRTDLVPSTLEPDSRVKSCGEFWAWVLDLERTFGDLLVIPHHTSALLPMPTDWDCHCATWETVAEVYSVHGNSMMENPLFDPMYYGERPSGSVHTALDETQYGYRMGFIAGSDSHDTRPGGVCGREGPAGRTVPFGGGLTIAMLDETEALSRTALHDALYDRRVYATSGPLLPAIVEWTDQDGNPAGIGEEISVQAGRPIWVKVRIRPKDSVHVTKVVVVGSGGQATELTSTRPGTYIAKISPAAIPDWAYVRIHIDGDGWWGEGACDDGGSTVEERIWMSPTWFD